MQNTSTVKPGFSLLVAALLASLAFLFAASVQAAEPRTGNSFDHVQTGFPLLGAHEQTECQTCHLQGVFKGTPRQCEYCHTQGSRIASTFKPSNHPQTTRPCSQCHTSQTSWSGARFDHIGVMPGTCATCHNGVNATGKPGTGHPVTTASCDKCHRTTAWLPAGYDHTGVVPGTCPQCHNGVDATGRPNNGIHPTIIASCDQCHSTRAWLPVSFNHVGVAQGSCAGCHNGTDALGMNAAHIPTATVQAGWSCDACHTYTARTFTVETFNHIEPMQGTITNNCISCHNGAYTSSRAQGMNAGHIPTNNLQCSACHTISASFNPSTFSHQAGQNVTAGQCITCHNGNYYTSSNAEGMAKDKNRAGYNHFPTSNSCDLCHKSYTSFANSITYDHSFEGVVLSTTQVCSGCHDGTHTIRGHVKGYRSGHDSLPRSGRCYDPTSCHTDFVDWGHNAGRIAAPTRKFHWPKKRGSGGAGNTGNTGSE